MCLSVSFSLSLSQHQLVWASTGTPGETADVLALIVFQGFFKAWPWWLLCVIKLVICFLFSNIISLKTWTCICFDCWCKLGLSIKQSHRTWRFEEDFEEARYEMVTIHWETLTSLIFICFDNISTYDWRDWRGERDRWWSNELGDGKARLKLLFDMPLVL